MHNIKELNELVLMKKTTQKEISEYLGLTRQSISKIFNGEYVKLSKNVKKKFNNLFINDELDFKYALSVIKLNHSMKLLLEKVKEVETSEVENLNQLLKNTMYWLEENSSENYMEKLNIQVQNFHMRINPFYLHFREFFHKDLQPLLTFQVDHKNKKVYDIVLGNVEKENYLNKERDLNYQINWSKHYETELDFEDFIEALAIFYEGKLRYTIFEDTVDSDFKFIEENVSKKATLKLRKIYFLDISRIFQLPGSNYRLEQILVNFLENIDVNELVRNSQYRNNQIIRMIRKLCEYDIKDTHDINSIFKVAESESYDKGKAETREIIKRRKRSDRSYEGSKD